MRLISLSSVFFVTVGIVLLSFAAQADEGMWVYNNLPKKQLKEKYGFDVSDAWADKVMKSSVRFNVGGSGSFVSANGLVITNHHVAADTIKKLSQGEGEKNYFKNGFYAKTQAEELKAPDLELNQLISIEDVTERVKGAVTAGMTPEQAASARKSEIARIEKESFEATKLRSDVITLYQGGEYHLYRYKKYTDVRLVFAPESAIAFFGGDPDNFEFPRFDLDVTFFRVYENGTPAKLENFFKWSANGTTDGELTFVSGNPGRTSRMFTEAAVRFLRDVSLPFTMRYLNWQEILLQTYSGRGERQRLEAETDLFSVANSRKVYLGRIAGLQDPSLIKSKQDQEHDLKSFAEASDDPELKKAAEAWRVIGESVKEYSKRNLLAKYSLLERGWAFNSELFTIARTLVRMAEEDTKPNDKRLAEYRDSNRESLKLGLYSDAAIHDEYEQFQMAQALSLLVSSLGADKPFVRAVLQGKSPEARAAELINGTTLKKINVRRQFGEGKAEDRLAALKVSQDPLIQLALAVDKAARNVRKEVETKITEPQLQAYAQIAKVMFAKYGRSLYPDATFTLRLAYGQVKGFPDKGTFVPPYTTIGGAFKHQDAHLGKEPYLLPKRWQDKKSLLNLDTPFNFVSTADIIGGNSGSPVINANAEFVGIIFDGNIHSLTSDYLYSDKQNRAVSVDSRGILEALKVVYEATALTDELTK